MSQTTGSPLERMQLTTTNRPLDMIRHWSKEGFLLLDPPYQRGDVWGIKRRVNLIRSLLLGIPIPSIIINDRMAADWGAETGEIAVIDGRQRCTTILQFLDSEFQIPGSWIGLSDSATFSDFPIARQRQFKNQPIGVCEGMLSSIEQEIEVFELVNFGGVAQGECDG